MVSTSTYASIGRAVTRATLAAGGAAVLGSVALGVRPRALPPVPGPRPTLPTVPVPPGLPAPVERWARATFGDAVPVVRTAVVTGRGTVRVGRPGRLPLPVRFRFWQEVGRAYRHDIEVCVAGVRVGRVEEWFADGHGRARVLGQEVSDNPRWDQGANLGLWIEALAWFPSVLLTHPAARWEPFDSDAAVLVVPFRDGEERVLVRFDADSARIRYWEMSRFPNGEGVKELYVNGTWFEDGRPWADFRVDEVALDVPVDLDGAGR